MVKHIKNYSSYKISESGEIWSNKAEKWLKPSLNNGYKHVGLYNNGKRDRMSVHRLVALNYVLLIEGKNYVNHIDGNKLNNHYTNLEWVTVAENCKHAAKLGLLKKWSAVKLCKYCDTWFKRDKYTRYCCDKCERKRQRAYYLANQDRILDKYIPVGCYAK